MKANRSKLITIIACLGIAYGLAFYLFLMVAPSKKEESHLSSNPISPEEVAEANEGPYDETLTIKEGDTLANILSRIGISSTQAHEAISALSKVFNPKDLKINQEVYVIYDTSDDRGNYNLKFLRLQPDFDQYIDVVQTGGRLFEATKYQKKLKHEYADISGDIKISLYADALKAGASPKMLYDMIKAFSYDIDFQRDIQPGTEFSLLYDTYKDEETGLERPGELLSATITIDGKPLEIFRFQAPGSMPEYYTKEGIAIRKALLKTPIDGARLTSGFGNRKHPIKGYTKMHKGVDFAAPKGTPIMAAGDGVVEKCSHYGGYGNYVCIRHNGITKTAYAHLSRYGKIKRGSKVRQGQIIGYVGNTGLTTGPHLHFELIQNGKHVNPQKVTQLPTTKLTGNAFKEFKTFIVKVEKIRQDQNQTQMASTLLGAE